MKVVEKFQNLLKDVESISGALMTKSGADEFKSKCVRFETLLERSQYVKVPLVGIFSAGKSSVLNIFTQKYGALPVDTTPETAVAYELYYSTEEKVDLYRDKSLVASVPLSDIKSLQTQPGDVAYVYMNSQPIKDLQEKGIILVDMPGIDSGNANHDAAIMNYIEYGTAFILLVDAEQGSLRDSTLQFIEELKKYNLKAAFLVSKIDKKPESAIPDIVDGIKFDAKRVFDVEPYVGTVSAVNNNIKALSDFLNTLDPEALLVEKVGAQFKNLVNSVIADLDNQIEDKGKSVEEAKSLLQAIEQELTSGEDVIKSADLSGRKSSDAVVEDILDNIAIAIKDKSESIARMVVNKCEEAEINSAISSIIRSELIASLKDRAQNYANNLGASVNDVISRIAKISVPEGGFKIDLGPIVDIIALIFPKVKWLKSLSKWANLLLKPLQDLLDFIFGKSDREKIAEVKEQINSIVLSIITELRPDVRSLVEETMSNIDGNIMEEVNSAINKKKDALRAKLADAQADEQLIKKQIDELNSAKSKLSSLIDSLK